MQHKELFETILASVVKCITKLTVVDWDLFWLWATFLSEGPINHVLPSYPVNICTLHVYTYM